MVAGLEDITSGEIRIDERVGQRTCRRWTAISRWCFQNYALYPHMSVYDNMAFGLKMRKFNKAEIEPARAPCRRHLGIQELLARRPRQLSEVSASASRGRADREEPRVFLFDEPRVQSGRETARPDAGGVEAPARAPQHHRDLRHHDQVEAHDSRRPRGGNEGRVCKQVGEADAALRQACQPASSRASSLAGDELPRSEPGAGVRRLYGPRRPACG